MLYSAGGGIKPADGGAVPKNKTDSLMVDESRYVCAGKRPVGGYLRVGFVFWRQFGGLLCSVLQEFARMQRIIGVGNGE